MSPERPDKPLSQATVSRYGREIASINGEFLQLLTHEQAAGVQDLLGLDAGTAGALRSLTAVELEIISEAPLLLAEFRPFPGLDEVRDGFAGPLGQPPVSIEWDSALNDFSNRLLTCIWQTARRNPMLTSLSLGIDRRQCELLADMNFCSISRFAADARNALRVRLGSHPRFWSDLVRLVRCGNENQLIASRLSLVQLSLAGNYAPRKTVKPASYLAI